MRKTVEGTECKRGGAISAERFAAFFRTAPARRPAPIRPRAFRRERDSNPRPACAGSGFQDRRVRPLRHLSTIFARNLARPPPTAKRHLTQRTPEPRKERKNSRGNIRHRERREHKDFISGGFVRKSKTIGCSRLRDCCALCVKRLFRVFRRSRRACRAASVRRRTTAGRAARGGGRCRGRSARGTAR